MSLSLAFLAVSEDASVGTERKSEDFWDTIKVKFQEIYSERKGVSASDSSETAATRTGEGESYRRSAIHDFIRNGLTY